jgi:hypothetical protein
LFKDKENPAISVLFKSNCTSSFINSSTDSLVPDLLLGKKSGIRVRGLNRGWRLRENKREVNG